MRRAPCYSSQSKVARNRARMAPSRTQKRAQIRLNRSSGDGETKAMVVHAQRFGAGRSSGSSKSGRSPMPAKWSMKRPDSRGDAASGAESAARAGGLARSKKRRHT